MKAIAELDGKPVELEIPEDKVQEYIRNPRTGYERNENGYFFYERYDGDIEESYDNNPCDKMRYENANYAICEQLAIDNARADKLMRQLRRYAAEHGGIPSVKDWYSRGDTMKYYIFFDYRTKEIRPCSATAYREQGAQYFLSEEARDAAIALFRPELEWYFTQYEGQVRA